MSHAHKRYADADATTESLLLVSKKIDEMDQRVTARLNALEEGQGELKSGQTRLFETTARIESLLGKLLDGQAVLHQNDMELKRRLDERKS
ncbi:MAG: hypothetical protein WCF85_17335 [Rhodospirillaceae bacterium]